MWVYLITSAQFLKFTNYIKIFLFFQLYFYSFSHLAAFQSFTWRETEHKMFSCQHDLHVLSSLFLWNPKEFFPPEQLLVQSHTEA